MSVVKLMKHIGLGHSLMLMSGKMGRNLDGTKNKEGVYPPKDFYEKADNRTLEPVLEQSKHYAIVSGVKNDEGRQLVSIDTDNKVSTEKMLKLIELEYKDYHFIWHSFFHTIKNDSHVRAKALFWATDELLEAFPENDFNGDIHVDTLIRHPVFCPCEYNECAKPWDWDGVSEIQDMPRSVLIWLKAEKSKKDAKKEVKDTEQELTDEQREGFQCDDLEHFVKTGEIRTDLRNVWFDPPEYREGRREKGDRITCVSLVPNHMGNEFFKRISGIMTRDVSVPPELAEKAFLKVNEIWAEKGFGPKNNLEGEVIKPFVHDRVAEGTFPYDPNWRKRLDDSLKFKDKEGHEWEIFTDEAVSEYVAVCRTQRKFEYFGRNRDKVKDFCFSRKYDLKMPKLFNVPDKHVVADMTLPYGETPEGHYNFFKQNAYLECIHNPDKYKEANGKRRRPDEFLAMLEHNIGDQGDIDRFLKYIATYFRTGRNPMLNFYFIGAQGSGKSLIAETLMKLMGEENCLSVLKPAHFMESYTDKFRNKYIILLEEIKDQLDAAGNVDRSFLGQLKTFTTKRPAPLRKMNVTNLIDYDARWLFMLNANLKPGEKLNLPPDERRGVVFESHSHWEDSQVFQDWIKDHKEEMGDMPPLVFFMECMTSEKGLLDIAWHITTAYPEDMDLTEWSRRWPTKASLKMTEGDPLFDDNLKIWLREQDLVSLYADALDAQIDDLFFTFPQRDGLYMARCALMELCEIRGRKMNNDTLDSLIGPLYGPINEGRVQINQTPLRSHLKTAREKNYGETKRLMWYAYKLEKFTVSMGLQELRRKAEEQRRAKATLASHQPDNSTAPDQPFTDQTKTPETITAPDRKPISKPGIERPQDD